MRVWFASLGVAAVAVIVVQLLLSRGILRAESIRCLFERETPEQHTTEMDRAATPVSTGSPATKAELLFAGDMLVHSPQHPLAEDDGHEGKRQGDGIEPGAEPRTAQIAEGKGKAPKPFMLARGKTKAAIQPRASGGSVCSIATNAPQANSKVAGWKVT